MGLAGPSAALTLEFPAAASQTSSRFEALTSYRMPVGPFQGDAVESLLIEGALDQRAWQLDAPRTSTLQLMKPLRDQLAGAGFRVIYECEAVICGGFDFRYGTEVLPEPDMHVDLGDFRYLAAERTTAVGPEYISLIVSRTEDQGFVQVTRVGHAAQALPLVVPPAIAPDAVLSDTVLPDTVLPDPPAQAPASDVPAVVQPVAPTVVSPVAGGVPGGGEPLAVRLKQGGAQVLPDLVFASGSASLEEGPFASLADLAAFLRDNPTARVILVGHTDASGDLASNTALSRERARSVRQRLLTEFDIPPGQIDAEGVGYLVPRAPNDTEAGRLANRRVEVMLLSAGTQ